MRILPCFSLRDLVVSSWLLYCSGVSRFSFLDCVSWWLLYCLAVSGISFPDSVSWWLLYCLSASAFSFPDRLSWWLLYCLALSHMVLKCFTWIKYLMNESIGLFSHSSAKGVVRDLPDDIVGGIPSGVVSGLPDVIVVDILSRLPAECVLICRNVCKRWRSLTSTEHFIQLQLSRATPAFFVQSIHYPGLGKGKPELGFFVYDATFPERKKMRKLPQFKITENIEDFGDRELMMGSCDVIGSCDGLLLFSDVQLRRKRYCYVINPITQEHTLIGFPTQGNVCGFFRHPISNEYKLLFYGLHHGCRQYFVHTLGGSLWRQINHPPFFYQPPEGRMAPPPAICNRALHWISMLNLRDPCANAILVFDMLTEEFHTLPHPGDRCFYPWPQPGEECSNDILTKICRHGKMGLLTANEQLSFHYLDEYKKFIDIWILEDYSGWGWVQKWKLNLNLPERPYEFCPGTPDSSIRRVDLVHIHDRQLWLLCERKGLFLYQLDQNTVTRLGEPPIRERSCRRCIVFTRNLVPLDNLSLVATKV